MLQIVIVNIQPCSLCVGILLQDIEEKILSMYAKGMSTGDIETHIRDIYGIEVSDTAVSRVTDKILPVDEAAIDALDIFAEK